MKRNLDLIRTILLKIEKQEIEGFMLSDIIDNECSMQEAQYHIDLLEDAKFIILGGSSLGKSNDGIFKNYIIIRMTSLGHDYLDSVRDSSIWEKTKEKCSKVESVSLGIIQNVASNLILSALGLKN